MSKGNKTNHPKGPRIQFCPKGHDTFVVGREPTGCCNECSMEYDAKMREKIRNGNHVVLHEKQICNSGHDTSICGRTKGGQCNTCYLEQKANRRMATMKCNNRRIKTIMRLKDKPCADCLGWFEPCQMDFDHRPGEIKLFGIREGITRVSLKEIILEIAKCDVVCANCHRLRTHKRLKQKIKK